MPELTPEPDSTGGENQKKVNENTNTSIFKKFPVIRILHGR
jgi:hypothetical protein